MSENKFKISGVGLDTTSLTYSLGPMDWEWVDYVYTSLSAGNDYAISGCFPKEPTLISEVESIECLGAAISGHLLTLGRSGIDLLILGPDTVISDKGREEITSVLDNRQVLSIGISGEGGLENTKRIYEELKKIIIPKYLKLELCPFGFDHETITWANTVGLDILGFNPFGGHYNSGHVIDSFSVPFLLGFSATYSTLVFLSGRDLYKSREQAEYLKALIGESTSPKYILSKSVNKLVHTKKHTPLVSTALRTGDQGKAIPFYNPEALFHPSELDISLGWDESKFPEPTNPGEGITSVLYDNVYNYLGLLEKPEKRGVWFSVIRPKVVSLVRSISSGHGFTTTVGYISPEVCLIRIVKDIVIKEDRGWWRPKRKIPIHAEHTYVLTLGKEKAVFLELSPQNSSQEG